MIPTPDYTHPWIVLTIFIWIVISLFFNYFKPSFLFVGSCMILVMTDVIEIDHLLTSISNKSILTIALLILVSSILRRNFQIEQFLDRLFEGVIRPKQFMIRMMVYVGGLSAFLNNTPIVHLMTPYVYDWSKKVGTHPSKLLIPLSFATILGGMITTIGTSTNLVLNGFLENNQIQQLTVIDFAPLGILALFLGIVYFYVIGFKLLPINKTAFSDVKAIAPEYLVATVINPGSKLIGKKVGESGLQSLDGAYLIEIHRYGEAIQQIEAEEELQPYDQLMFMGKTDHIMKIVQSDIGLDLPNHEEAEIIEAVIPANSTLAGKTVYEADFPKNFKANLLAVHRHGQQMKGGLQDRTLASGDLLLLSIDESVIPNISNVTEFYTLSKIQQKQALSAGKIRLTLLTILSCFFLIGFGFVSTFEGIVLLLMAFWGLKIFNLKNVFQDLDLDMMILLVGALTFGNALIDSGAASFISSGIITLFIPFGKEAVLIGLLVLTVILTSFVTNVAAVSIMFPLAFSLSQSLGISGHPFFIAIAFGASAAFLTPVSYQTNWMVYGPGGYQPKDFLKVGLPLTVLYIFATIAYILIFYPFHKI